MMGGEECRCAEGEGVHVRPRGGGGLQESGGRGGTDGDEGAGEGLQRDGAGGLEQGGRGGGPGKGERGRRARGASGEPARCNAA